MRSAIAFTLFALALTTACAEYVGLSTTPAGVVRSVALSAASGDTLTSAGATRVVAARVKDVFGDTVPSPEVVWRTSDPAVATVAGTGSRAVVTAVGDGTATVSATSEGVVGAISITVQHLTALSALRAEPEPTAPSDVPRDDPALAPRRAATRRSAPTSTSPPST